MAKRKRAPEKVFAHGAVKAVTVGENGWIYFGATVGEDDYPVCFRPEQLPSLIKWLQYQVEKEGRRG